MLCTCNTKKHLHSQALMTWKNEITALIITSTTQRYQAAECSSNYNGKNVRGPHTNCFKCNQIFTFPSNARCRAFFKHSLWTLPLVTGWSGSTERKNQHVIVYVWINFALCTRLSRMHLGPLLVFCVTAPDWAWQLCTISCYGSQLHRQREREKHQMLCLRGASRTCKQTFPQSSYLCRAEL